MIYFSSDLHFSHNKNFLYEPRGFSSIEEHNAKVIENWNSVVKPDDIVYILGDLVMNDLEEGMKCLRQLQGNKLFVIGNHDTKTKIVEYEKIAENCGYATLLKYGKWLFYLSHYPTMVNNYEERKKFFCLHGHVHGADRFQFLNHCCYNVALDAHNNCPVSIEEIKVDLRERLSE